MARRGKKKTKPKPAPPPKEVPFHNPFAAREADLKGIAARPSAPAKTPAEPVRPQDDGQLFLQAMADVAPLDSGEKALPAPAVRRPPPAEDEELEVLALLADLVSGVVPLDVRDTDEYVQGARPGLNPDVVHRLAQGLFPVGGHMDLHGMTVTESRRVLEEFLVRSRRNSLRCVLIIHGRGLSSPEGKPVLKPHVVNWLSRSGLRKHVLAFATARPYDGGAGAVYVLLKK